MEKSRLVVQKSDTKPASHFPGAQWDTISWINEGSTKTDLFAVWPLSKNTQAWIEVEVQRNKNNERFLRAKRKNVKSVAPLRLFDCETLSLKDRETYLRETNGIAPEYVIVSQVWGNPEYELHFPTVKWRIPISSQDKWDSILGYCKEAYVKWMWLDIMCINQADSEEAREEKKTEIPLMGEYYRGAEACLVVPQNYTGFSATFSRLMDFYSEIIDSEAPVSKNAHRIWETLGLVDAVVSDQWFWRIWTYQELLLPERHVLLDGQIFHFHKLQSLLGWYRRQLQSRSLSQPAGGADYPFIQVGSDSEMSFSRHWLPEDWINDWDRSSDRHWGSWSVKDELEEYGSLDLITLAVQTRGKKCTHQVDRLLGLYGLLKENEMVPIRTTENRDNPTALLEEMWKDTLRKVVLSGNVWPLLHDIVNLESGDATEGEMWMPEITALQKRPLEPFYSRPETLNHLNTGKIAITPAGLKITVRVIGQVVGASVNLAGGEGEAEKLLALLWILNAKGLNTEPIIDQVGDGCQSVGASKEQTSELPRVLDSAMSALSLKDYFSLLEDVNAAGIVGTASGGTMGVDKTVLAVRIEGAKVPIVTLAWTHRTSPPRPSNCWIMDVTSEPVKGVKRWVIANQIRDGVFRKIGTLPSFPSLIARGSNLGVCRTRSADILFC